MAEEPEQEDLPELDVADPLKRDEDGPGIDPIVIVPPEE